MKKAFFIANVVLASTLSNLALAAEVPDEVNKKFLEAIQARESGDVFASIELLEQLMAAQPQYKRAELELAVAYYRAKLYADSKAYAEDVLSDPTTPDAVKETIDLFLSQLVAEQEAADEIRHNFSGSIGFGGGNDSNVQATPDSTNLSGTTLTLSPGFVAQEDNYGMINLFGRHAYTMPGTVDLGSRPVLREWVSALNLYRKAYVDQGDYNLDVVTLTTGMDLISSTNWRASIAARVDDIRLGDKALGLFKGLNASYTMIEDVNEYTFTADITQQDYDGADFKDREGVRSGLGAELMHQFTSAVAGKVALNVALTNAKEDYKTHVSKSIGTGLYYTGIESFLIYGELDYKAVDYDGVEISYNHSRNETQVMGVLGATYSIAQGPLADWHVNARVSGTNNTSDVSIYDYTRTDASLDLSKRF